MNYLPENISTFGADLDGLTILITVLATVWFFAAFLTMSWFLIAYRKKAGQKAEYINGDSFSQYKWILIILIFVVASDLYIDIVTVNVWNKIKIHLPQQEQSVRVEINAYQWAWKFRYPGADGKLGTDDDLKSFTEMHVPVNKDVLFDLTAKDVLHSFWVKELRLKQDALPGRTIQGWFNATKTGKYEIMCAEICGINHTAMKGYLVVDSEEDYAKFLGGLKKVASAESQNKNKLAVNTGDKL